jgi:hypothetical protein
MLAPKTAQEVALRVLTEVPLAECEEAARRVAQCFLRVETFPGRDESSRMRRSATARNEAIVEKLTPL